VTTTTSTTTTTLPSVPGPGCADGTREGLVDSTAHPDIAACAGIWQGPVGNGGILCEEGWGVCSPEDLSVLQTVDYTEASAFAGCFAYDAAEDNNPCMPCRGDAGADDMAGMGQACQYHASGAPSCISSGRVDATCCDDSASGTACQFKPGLTTGVVCCRQSATTSTSTTTTSTTTTSSTTTTTLAAACQTAADCDDGDPCNGTEGCVDGRCLVARGLASTCQSADPIAVVTRFHGDAVDFCNTASRTVESSVPVGHAPWGIAWQPDRKRIFVTNRQDASVSVVDTVTRAVVATIDVGTQPLGVAVHPFLPRAYVAAYGDDVVDVIDTTTLAVVDTIHVGNGPAGLAVHPAGGRLYVANYLDGTVSAIDVPTGHVVATVPTPALPVGVAVHPAGTKVYVTCLKDRQVAVLGTVSDTVLGVMRVGRRPVGIAFDHTGTRAYVTNSSDDTLTVVDAAADRVLTKTGVGHFPLGVAVTGEGAVWIANSRDDAMSVVGPGGTTASVPIADTPVAIGDFIGTPPDDCPTAPLPCDDANPFTGDACQAGLGCQQQPTSGVLGLHAGVDAIGEIVGDASGDPLLALLAGELPALQSALSAAETGGDRGTLRLVRRTLKPLLQTLERAKRHGALGATGARLLDIVRGTRAQLKQLAHHGRR
jgi:YVTN family beta-propeller protein